MPRSESSLDCLIYMRQARKVDVRIPGKGNSNSHGARPGHLIITMIKWIWTSMLSTKNCLSASNSLHSEKVQVTPEAGLSISRWALAPRVE